MVARNAPTSMMPSMPTLITPPRSATASPMAAKPMAMPRRRPAPRNPVKSIRSTSDMGGSPPICPRKKNHGKYRRCLDDVDERERHPQLALQRSGPREEHAEQNGRKRDSKRVQASYQ